MTDDESPGVITELLRAAAAGDAIADERLFTVVYAAIDPRRARVVELRWFAGLDATEVAKLLNVGTATVTRDWAAARLVGRRTWPEVPEVIVPARGSA
ncbi:MAG: ECF-type sigma factor [Gemmatimonas sp.]